MSRIYEDKTFEKLRELMSESKFNKVFNKADNLMNDIEFLNEMSSRMKKDTGYGVTIVPTGEGHYKGIVPTIFQNILSSGSYIRRDTLYKYYNFENAVWIDHVLKSYLICPNYDKEFTDKIEEMINEFVPCVTMRRIIGSHGELDNLWFDFKIEE